MHVLTNGRLVADVKVGETRTGDLMANSALAARIDSRSEDLPDSMLLGLVAFGDAAEALRLHGRGDTLTVTGVLQQQLWEGKTRFSILVDGCESARTSRERARRRRSDAQAAED
jgi:single-strand DNA-binding protein